MVVPAYRIFMSSDHLMARTRASGHSSRRLGDGFDSPDQTAHSAHRFVQCRRESQRGAAIGDRIMDQSVGRLVEPMQPGRSQHVLRSVTQLLERFPVVVGRSNPDLRLTRCQYFGPATSELDNGLNGDRSA